MPRSRRKLRFSLLSLFVAFSIVALCISYWLKQRSLSETHAALKALRNDIGELTVEDRNLLHAIAIPSYEGMTYRWRVFLPRNRKFWLKTAIGKIPESGLPNMATSQISTREFDTLPRGTPFILTSAVNRNHLGEWQLVLDDGDENSSIRIPKDQTFWLNKTSGHTWHQAGRGETVSVDRTSPLFLLRHRQPKVLPSGGITVDMNPTNGILIWISGEP